MTEAALKGVVERAKVLDTTRRYTSRAKDCESVWLARLDALDALGETVEADKVWHEARRSVSPHDVKVWMWGLSKPFNQDKRLNVYEVTRPNLWKSAALKQCVFFRIF